MAKNRNSKQNAKINAELKKGNLADKLSIILPIVGVFVFLVGGILLFMHLHEGRRLPDDEYLAAEKLVESGELIGLTLEECRMKIGTFAVVTSDENGEEIWVFPRGKKQFSNGEGVRFYEIVVTPKDDVAFSAIFREALN